MSQRRKVKRKALSEVERYLRAEAERQGAAVPPPRRAHRGLVYLFAAALVGALLTLLACNLSAEPLTTKARIVARLAGTPASDARWVYVDELALAIDRAAQIYELPAPVLEAVLFRESSYKLGVCGKAGELGLAQAHGAALAWCRAAGLDPTSSISSSVGCAAAWLDYLQGECHYLVRDARRCHRDRVGSACDGALSAYLSGRCVAESDIVAGRVALRLPSDIF